MKVKVLLTGICMILLSNVSYGSAYKADDSSIDAIVANAVEISALDYVSAHDFHGADAMLSADKNGWTAFVLSYFVGYFGIHRHYLGTKGSMWALYTFTCGGIFGVVAAVDIVVLFIGAIQKDISKYVDNRKFIMW